MPRRPALVTQADLARAFRVAKAEGAVVELRPDGVIRIVPADLVRPGPQAPVEVTPEIVL